MSFETMNLKETLLKSIQELGFEKPTQVQAEAIPKAIEGHDLIVMAKTGSGKTGAFGLPMLQRVQLEKGTQGIIITPTRELAVQVNKDLQSYSKYDQCKTTVVYGQHSMGLEIKELKKKPAIVIGTPGRLMHHIKERNIDVRNIEFLVLDEADRMFDMGFIDQMKRIIKALPADRQTMLFSATMPDEIKRITKQYMKEPQTIEIDSDTKTVDTIEQSYMRVLPNEKRKQLERLLTVEQPKGCMIFSNTRIEVDKIYHFLDRKGFVCEALHGANTQSKRMRTINEFKAGEIQILVATDVAARGIHIDDMSLVINYDVPQDKDNYIHRIGRTGRAGSGGKAITFVTSDEIMSLYEIEEHVGAMIQEIDLPTDAEVEKALDEMTDYWVEIRKKRSEQKKINEQKAENRKKSKPGQQHRRNEQLKNKKPYQKNKQKHHYKPKPHAERTSHSDRPRHNKEHEVIKKVNPVQKERPVVQQPKVVVTQPVVETKKKFSLKNIFKKKK